MSSPMYTDFAKEYESAVRDNSYNAKFERPSFLSILPNLNGKNVLDLGCGPGVYAEELAKKGAVVTAVDNSHEMIEITKQKIGAHHKAYVQDISIGLPQEATGHFDIVICPLAIHYLESIDTLFREIKRVLTKSGIFVFSTNHPYVDFSSSPSGNYFTTEKITEEWNTLGRPIPVSYYRRPISSIANSIFKSGMVISNISEGKPTEELRKSSPALFQKLSTKPNFMFYVCQPAQ